MSVIFPQIFRFLVAMVIAATIYLTGMLIGDWLLGSRELWYQWEFESKRQLVLQLFQHIAIAGGAMAIGVIVLVMVYGYNRYAGRLGLVVAVGAFCLLVGWNWPLALTWSLGLVAALLVLRGARF